MATKYAILFFILLYGFIVVQASCASQACFLPRDRGHRCRSKSADSKKKFTRYFHHSVLNRCMPFYYEGCGGNANLFVDKTTCIATCPKGVRKVCKSTDGWQKIPDVPEVCMQDLDPGFSCKQGRRSIHYYFNPVKMACVPFWFSGCGGNENNFMEKNSCDMICLHVQPPMPGNGQTDENDVPDVCQLKKDVGFACEYGKKAKHYYYDKVRNRCVAFWFFGCGGNKNNFVSKDACDWRCSRDPMALGIDDSVRNKKHLNVPKKSKTKKKTNKQGKKKKKQKYEEDEDEEEDDRTIRKMLKVSEEEEEPIEEEAEFAAAPEDCFQDKDKGFRCKDGQIEKHFYHHPVLGRCVSFVYKGCGGNKNNFKDKTTCDQKCRPTLAAEAKAKAKAEAGDEYLESEEAE